MRSDTSSPVSSASRATYKPVPSGRDHRHKRLAMPFIDNGWVEAIGAGLLTGPVFAGATSFTFRRRRRGRQSKARQRAMTRSVERLKTAMFGGFVPTPPVIAATYYTICDEEDLDRAYRQGISQVTDALVSAVVSDDSVLPEVKQRLIDELTSYERGFAPPTLAPAWRRPLMRAVGAGLAGGAGVGALAALGSSGRVTSTTTLALVAAEATATAASLAAAARTELKATAADTKTPSGETEAVSSEPTKAERSGPDVQLVTDS